MGTRGCIARLTGEGKFQGCYHHWDSYPEGLGKTLYELYNGHFQKDIKSMLKYLIDDHPAGWSTINNADFNEPPGFNENGFTTNGAQCYCHGGRHEEENIVTEKDAAEIGCEYVYAIIEKTGQMLILSSYNEDGSKMIGMFGFGNDKADWHTIGIVDLNNEEQPDWENFS